MSDMVSVPAEKIAALREALGHRVVADFSSRFHRETLYAAARAVVDAVETEDEPTANDEERHRIGACSDLCLYCHGYAAPSPARDDTETVIAGLLAEHQYRYPEWRDGEWFVRCSCDADLWIPTKDGRDHEAFRAHVASVIAAHMAAPDELTALRERVAELESDIQGVAGGALVEEAEQSVRRIHAEVERDVARQALTSADAMNRHWDEINAHRDLLVAERDALREGIRRLTESGPLYMYPDLLDLLGDA